MATGIKKDLTAAYKAKGAQQSTLQEYRARQEKAQKKPFKLPTAVKYILLAPFFLIFIFGLFFIPYLSYKALTAPSSSSSTASDRN